MVLTTRFGPLRYSLLAHFDTRNWPTYGAYLETLVRTSFPETLSCSHRREIHRFCRSERAEAPERRQNRSGQGRHHRHPFTPADRSTHPRSLPPR